MCRRQAAVAQENAARSLAGMGGVHVSMYVPTNLAIYSIDPSMYLRIYLSICLSVYLSKFTRTYVDSCSYLVS